ncbi:transglutaminase-like domain-containing protein [Cyclobacterium plantarum]|uniref:Transglutaminase domain-containing protein n=1 Tax=Cyclobacterium plantarum TaxID=2716263 RepID=A0ABX0HBF8_9BACT|nr:transglutaminase-like domain-containing protein [Cyclobacterium plantarum]NHE58253.1 transglutaminase domain-containing protein [Cyclobacterium plantarum]
MKINPYHYRIINTACLFSQKLLILGLILFYGCQPNEKKENAQQENKVVSRPKVDIADIEKGIKAYIDSKTEENDGFFIVKDGDKLLRLKLVRVHTEYLSNLGPKSHFACVDLADANGDVYDVDFFMEGDPGAMDVTATSVHKLNGKPFYSWKQKEDKTWYKLPIEEATNELLGVIEGEDQFVFNYQATLPILEEAAEMWIPIALSDAFQQVELVTTDIPGIHRMIEDKVNLNQILYMKLGPEHSGQKVRLVYKVNRKEKGPYTAQEEVADRYLASNRLMPVDRRFREIAMEAIGEKNKDSQLMQARAIYDYIIDNMRYAKSGEYGKGDAVYACDAKTGNCTEFHSLFISLARSVGIPARFSIGAAIPSDRNEGGIDGYHCWAEFFAEGKWWPVDISEGNKYTALATYYFGRHPANRIEFSRGRDLELNPGPASGPINFLAYPLLEIDGKSAVAQTTFTFSRSN